jgi:hypothetical protein
MMRANLFKKSIFRPHRTHRSQMTTNMLGWRISRAESAEKVTFNKENWIRAAFSTQMLPHKAAATKVRVIYIFSSASVSFGLLIVSAQSQELFAILPRQDYKGGKPLNRNKTQT